MEIRMNKHRHDDIHTDKTNRQDKQVRHDDWVKGRGVC